jgi:L-amino acid N-acyltransferase YncA
VTIRVARATDAESVAEIYNQGTAERNATFETEPRTPADLARRIEDDPRRFPVIVVEGRALAAPFHELPAFLAELRDSLM